MDTPADSRVRKRAATEGGPYRSLVGAALRGGPLPSGSLTRPPGGRIVALARPLPPRGHPDAPLAHPRSGPGRRNRGLTPPARLGRRRDGREEGGPRRLQG